MPRQVKAAVGSGNYPPLPAIRPVDGPTLSLGSTSQATESALGVTLVRLVSDVDCHVVVGPPDGEGAGPTASTSSMLLKADAPEYFHLNTDDKVAARKASGADDGTLFITLADETVVGAG